MLTKGYVAVSGMPLTKLTITAFVDWWLENFEKVEQAIPGPASSAATVEVKAGADIIWNSHMEFRVVHGDDFSWVYLALDRFILETSGNADEDNPLPLGALVELPGIVEIIDQNDDKRLDQLEAKGLL